MMVPHYSATADNAAPEPGGPRPINASAEGQIDLFGNTRTAPTRIALFHLDHGANDVGFGSFWSGLRSPLR